MVNVITKCVTQFSLPGTEIIESQPTGFSGPYGLCCEHFWEIVSFSLKLVGICSCYIHFGIYKWYIPIDSWISYKCLTSLVQLACWYHGWSVLASTALSMNLRAVTFLQNTVGVTALSLFQLRILVLISNYFNKCISHWNPSGIAQILQSKQMP